jgi:hypothetical protein
MINASECARKSGKYAFGLDETQTAQALRKLADDIETGTVALHSVSTSTRAAHEEFTIRELVIEILEENPVAGPRMIRS